jgi:hypothetical protein
MAFTAHEELARQLEEIRQRQGELTPRAVLADVKQIGKKHPLYSEFEWDNRIAGEAHRIDQAHKLITKVRVVYRDANDDEQKVRAFVAVPRPSVHQPNYERVEDVALDPLKRKIILQDAERRWKALRTQYGHLDEFMDIVRHDVNGNDGNGDDGAAQAS